MHGPSFDVMPSTYALPQEYVQFVAEFGELEHMLGRARNLWILKPVGSSRGRGIRVLNDISAVHYSQEVVLQRYVDRPLTLGGRKFDLRVYVLVTSVRPLEAFVYSEGLARLASRPYSTSEAGLADNLVHLTNTAVQRNAPDEANAAGASAGHPAAPEALAGEATTKCSFARLRERLLAEAGVEWESLWARICETVVRSLVAVEDAIVPHRCAFELFGYDVLVEEGTLRPWLIEANASPSLERETKVDAQLKERLIADTARLVAPPYFDRAVLRRMAEWRLSELGKGARAASRLATPPFEQELHALLHGGAERRFGEMPRELGLYQRLVPSAMHERITRAISKKRPGVRPPSGHAS
ncbi:tubulin-tyrosine ligase family-domain-containing protein [Pavlovales sp. CCMP2436]|nr:tubulin-tyrosine ligase family-domain-containing protein [Pavlovales sp. CCMP2436]